MTAASARTVAAYARIRGLGRLGWGGPSQAKKSTSAGSRQRTEDRDPANSLAPRDAQCDAELDWGIPDHGALQRLTGMQAPTFIIQGDDDLMIPTRLSYLMAGLTPYAWLRIYPEAAHGSLFQYPQEAAMDVNTFLS